MWHLVGHDAGARRAVRRAEARPALAERVGRPRAAALVFAVAEIHGARLAVGAAEPLPLLPGPAERGLLQAGPGDHALAQPVLMVDLAFLLVAGAAGGRRAVSVGRGLGAVQDLARRGAATSDRAAAGQLPPRSRAACRGGVVVAVATPAAADVAAPSGSVLGDHAVLEQEAALQRESFLESGALPPVRGAGGCFAVAGGVSVGAGDIHIHEEGLPLAPLNSAFSAKAKEITGEDRQDVFRCESQQREMEGEENKKRMESER